MILLKPSGKWFEITRHEKKKKIKMYPKKICTLIISCLNSYAEHIIIYNNVITFYRKASSVF